MIISDAGPLVALARIGKLDLLRDYFNNISIPNEVYNEICIRGKEKPGAEEIEKASWISRKQIKDDFAVELLGLELDRGEAEVIVLAKELNATLVLVDERIPREMLELIGFKVIGTIGILIKAAKEGKLNLKNSLDELRDRGFWLSEDVYNQALKFAEKR